MLLGLLESDFGHELLSRCTGATKHNVRLTCRAANWAIYAYTTRLHLQNDAPSPGHPLLLLPGTSSTLQHQGRFQRLEPRTGGSSAALSPQHLWDNLRELVFRVVVADGRATSMLERVTLPALRVLNLSHSSLDVDGCLALAQGARM